MKVHRLTGRGQRADYGPHPVYETLRRLGLRGGDPTVMPLAEARAANAAFYAQLAGPMPPVAMVRTVVLDGPPGLRIYYPSSEAVLPAVVYFHGGGYALNSLDTHDRLMRELAVATGAAVIGVGYSLAPEQRWPTPLHEALRAIDWLTGEGAAHGLDPARFALAGDSAGAHLALCAALALRDAGGPQPRQLALAYGMYQRDLSTPSHRLFGGGAHGLTSERMAWFWQAIGDATPEPLRAELRGLPLTHLVVPQFDCLRDDSLALAGRLQEARVPLRLSRYPGTQHSFLQYSRILPLAATAIADMAGTLRCRLGASRPAPTSLKAHAPGDDRCNAPNYA